MSKSYKLFSAQKVKRRINQPAFFFFYHVQVCIIAPNGAKALAGWCIIIPAISGAFTRQPDPSRVEPWADGRTGEPNRKHVLACLRSSLGNFPAPAAATPGQERQEQCWVWRAPWPYGRFYMSEGMPDHRGCSTIVSAKHQVFAKFQFDSMLSGSHKCFSDTNNRPETKMYNYWFKTWINKHRTESSIYVDENLTICAGERVKAWITI